MEKNLHLICDSRMDPVCDGKFGTVAETLLPVRLRVGKGISEECELMEGVCHENLS